MNKFLKVLIKPSEVFREEKEKASIRKAILIFLLTTFVVGIINVVGFFLNPQSLFLLNLVNLILPIKIQLIQLIIIIFFLVILPTASIIIVFLFSLFGFAISKLLGGTGSYRIFLYCASIYYVPLGLITAIFSQIPIIGQYITYAIIAYAIYPFTVALKESFNLSTRKAIAVWLVPSLIVFPIIFYPILTDWYQQQEQKRVFSDVDLMIDAINSDNVNLCKSISDAIMKNNCITIINKDTTKCSGSEGQINYCYKEIAKKTNNADLCLSVKDVNMKKECVEDVAIATKDSSLCNKLSDEPYQLYPDDSERRDCFYLVGIKLQDISTCSLVTSEEKRITCTAIAENDITVCNQLKDSYKIQNCERIFRHFLKS